MDRGLRDSMIMLLGSLFGHAPLEEIDARVGPIVMCCHPKPLGKYISSALDTTAIATAALTERVQLNLYATSPNACEPFFLIVGAGQCPQCRTVYWYNGQGEAEHG